MVRKRAEDVFVSACRTRLSGQLQNGGIQSHVTSVDPENRGMTKVVMNGFEIVGSIKK